MADDRRYDYPRSPTCSGCKRGQQRQALGRSCGGFSTKIHASCDALGNPTRYILTGGEVHEITQVDALVEDQSPTALLADKGYASYEVKAKLESQNILPVIPPKANFLKPWSYDKILYKERKTIEHLFNKLKHFRRISTRYDKLALSYLSFLYLASIWLWLK
jgi:transposase